MPRNGDRRARVLVFKQRDGRDITGKGASGMLRTWEAAACSAVLVLVPFTDAGTALAQDSSDVRATLARAEQVYDGLTSLQAEFEQTIEVTLLGRSRTGVGTWYQKGRGRFKMDFSDPADDLIVADGNHLWLYYPSTHPGQVIRGAIEADVTGAGMVDLQGRIFDEASSAYDAELEGRESIDDHATLRIRLTPRGESPYRWVRVWIDASSYLVRKFEILENNETLRTVVLRDLRPNQPISDDQFRFTPPPGTDVFES